jgi:hypothetical protein
MWLAVGSFCADLEANVGDAVVVEGSGEQFCSGTDMLNSNVSELRSLAEAAATSDDFHIGRTAFNSKRQPKYTWEG